MKQELIYLDHAAATPVDPVVLDSMMPYFSDKFFNPSSPYSLAVEVKRDYQDAKSRIARVLGAKSDEIIMTAGATESVNIAFSSASGQILVPRIEHVATLAAAKRQGETIYIDADKRGRVTVEAVGRALGPQTKFISVGLVNNELGTVQPIEDIARLIEQERQRRKDSGEETQLLFHCDASQAAALIDVKVRRLGVDLLTLSAAKVYGPKQVGLLWVRPGVMLEPTIVGGGQEGGLRSGTENVAGVVGFATALELADRRRPTELKRLRTIRDEMLRQIEQAVPTVVVSTDTKRSLASFLNLSFLGLDAERLIFMLEAQGVMVATGSACAANKGTRSHVLEAIGLDDEAIQGSLRISLGRLSSAEDVSRATDLIIQAVSSEGERLARR